MITKLIRTILSLFEPSAVLLPGLTCTACPMNYQDTENLHAVGLTTLDMTAYLK